MNAIKHWWPGYWLKELQKEQQRQQQATGRFKKLTDDHVQKTKIRQKLRTD